MKAATIATVTMAFKKDQLGDLDALSFFVSRNSDFFNNFSALGLIESGLAQHQMITCCYVVILDKWVTTIVALSDTEIEKTVLQDLMKTIGVNGTPLMTVVSRWKNAMPQYTVGHEAMIERVKQELRRTFPNY